MSDIPQDSPSPAGARADTNPAAEPCSHPITLRAFHTIDGVPVGSDTIEARCRTWHCPSCAERRKIEVAKHLRAGIAIGRAQHDRIRLVTFTIDPKTWPHDYPMSAASVRDFNRRVSRVIHDYRRIYGLRSDRTPFCRVNEPTTNRRPHAHLLWRGDRRSPPLKACTNRDGSHDARCTGRRPCIKALAVRHGLGRIVDVRAKLYGRPITSEAAARYLVGKYLAKSLAAPIWPKHARRYTYSPGWADGLTLGRIHARYVADVLARLVADGRHTPPPANRQTVWEVRPEHLRPRLHATSPRGPDPLHRSATTGEALPVPF